MPKPLVAGNWKMNASQEQVKQLMGDLVRGCVDINQIDMVVCPPAPYLCQVSEIVSHDEQQRIKLGGQNCSNETKGALTGEISPDMLLDVGCQYVIVGHSERRAKFGESDDFVSRKFIAAQAVGLCPILCLGETKAEREAGQTFEVIRRQLDMVFNQISVSSVSDMVIAYEPVWAIGTGQTATPQQAEEVHAFIRAYLREQDDCSADKTAILYGGSLKSHNAKAIFSQSNIDGGLIGGASLDSDEFLTICRHAAATVES